MNSIERAIRDAVKGGYKPKYSNVSHREHWFGFEECMNLCLPSLFLDPDFWRCLGIARGWSEYMDTDHVGREDEYIQDFSWRVQRNRLINTLDEGKDAESFFADLEAQNK